MIAKHSHIRSFSETNAERHSCGGQYLGKFTLSGNCVLDNPMGIEQKSHVYQYMFIKGQSENSIKSFVKQQQVQTTHPKSPQKNCTSSSSCPTHPKPRKKSYPLKNHGRTRKIDSKRRPRDRIIRGFQLEASSFGAFLMFMFRLTLVVGFPGCVKFQTAWVWRFGGFGGLWDGFRFGGFGGWGWVQVRRFVEFCSLKLTSSPHLSGQILPIFSI